MKLQNCLDYGVVYRTESFQIKNFCRLIYSCKYFLFSGYFDFYSKGKQTNKQSVE